MYTTPIATKSSRPRLFIDCWNTLACPSKLVEMIGGSTRSATSLTCAVATPSETPGFNPNDTDTDGSWPEWLIDCGPTVSANLITASSGTSAPLGALNATFSSESTWPWYFGSSSTSTRYWAMSL